MKSFITSGPGWFESYSVRNLKTDFLTMRLNLFSRTRIIEKLCFCRLLQQLLEVQKSYGEMLKKSIAEKKLQMVQLQ